MFKCEFVVADELETDDLRTYEVLFYAYLMKLL